jgi:predicted RNA-binding Zn ribbon-like protein
VDIFFGCPLCETLKPCLEHFMSGHERSVDDRSPERLPLIGGALCLDFCNTISWRTSPEPVERLGGYDELLRWSVHAGGIPPAALDAPNAPSEAAAAYGRALALRSRLTAVFEAIAAGRDPGADDLDAVRLAYAEAISAARLRVAVVDWPDVDGRDRPLWPIAHSAWALLTAPQRPRVRLCGGAGCGWLFVDGTRNGSRRWCSGGDCGRRERVRRHRARRGLLG